MNKQIGNKKIWIVGIIAILSAVPVVLFAALFGDRPNYAQQVAKPLEGSLVNSGGKIISSGGDNGRGLDSQTPYYDATLDMPLGEEETVNLINDISNDNGYRLTHASTDQRGFLGAVADKYINEWYFDDTSKNSPYHQLQDGKIQIAFHVGDEDIEVKDGRTVLRLNVRLPSFK